MGIPQSTPRGCCRYCGAQLKPGQGKCWLCNAQSPARDRAGTACIGISRPAEPTGHFQYGISSLLLVITLFAILCSITKMNPGLGIMAAILAVPALLWTTFAAVRRRDHGDPMSSGEKAGVFLLTVFAVFGVIIAVIGAFAVAFFAMCAVTSGPGQDEFGSLILSVICGGVAALAAAVFCVWILWKVLHHNRGR